MLQHTGFFSFNDTAAIDFLIQSKLFTVSTEHI